MSPPADPKPPPLEVLPLPAAYLRLVLEMLRGTGDVRAPKWLASAGLAESDLRAGAATTVPFGLAAELMQNVAAESPAGWHLALVPRLDAAAHGPLGFALLSAASLAQAIETLIAYSEIRFPFVWFTSSVDREMCRLQCLPRGDLGTLRQPLMELAVTGVVRLVDQLSGHAEADLVASFPGEPPPYADALREVTPARVAHRADAFRVDFPASWLDEPGLLADEGMYRLSVGKCRELLRAAGGGSALEISIRQELLAAHGRSPGLDALARSRNISSRTLMRRLAARGTSYRRLLAEVHSRLAADLLRHTDLPVAEIAARLGFSDPANFGRAFRGWYGVPPGRFRER